jgi:hypothetical protein
VHLQRGLHRSQENSKIPETQERRTSANGHHGDRNKYSAWRSEIAVVSQARKRRRRFPEAVRVFATDAGESVAQVSAIQEPVRHLADDRSPEAVPIGEAFLVHSLEVIKVILNQAVKRRGFRIAR